MVNVNEYHHIGARVENEDKDRAAKLMDDKGELWTMQSRSPMPGKILSTRLLTVILLGSERH